MNTFIVILIVLAMAATVVALVRGIVIFLQDSRAEVDAGGTGPSVSAQRQNKMMFARIGFQAVAVLLVVLLMMVAGGRG